MERIDSNWILNQVFVGGTPYNINLGYLAFKLPGTYQIVRALPFYIGNTGTINNPAALTFNSDANATINTNGYYITIKRRF